MLHMSSSFWLLWVESHDFSHALKERTACIAGQIHKMTTIFTQNGPRLSLWVTRGHVEHFSYCQQDEYCNWFSYDPIGRVCELFESCQSLSVEFCPQCVSGESSCEPRVCSIAGICEVCKEPFIYYVSKSITW